MSLLRRHPGLNPFVLPARPRDGAAVQRELAREAVRRELPMTYAAQVAGLLVTVVGVAMDTGWIVALGVLRFCIDAVNSRQIGRMRDALETQAPLDGLIERRLGHFGLSGAVWGMTSWPAWMLPLTTVHQVTLVTVSVTAIVIMTTATCFVPRFYQWATVGFASTLLPPVVLAGGWPGAVVLVAVPALLFLLWELGRSTRDSVADRFEMQLERDRAITAQRGVIVALEAARRQATQAAATDTVTGLPNRQAFLDALDARIDADGGPFLLLLLDLDFFKNINDTLGHHAGDAVLVGFAGIVSAPVGVPLQRAADTLFAARLGGDEFAVLVDGDGAGAEALHASWMRALAQLVLPGYGVLPASVSCGTARWPQDGADRRALLNAADMALRRAKATCRGTQQPFEIAMTEVFLRETRIANLLAQSIDERRFAALLQPQVRMTDGVIVGAEVLTRFTHPELATFDVQAVFDVAEERGLGQRLSAALIDLAFDTLGALQPRLQRAVPIAINLSPSTMKNPARLLAQLRSWVERGVAPGGLKLELTEDAVAGRGLGHVRQTLDTLAAMGFRLSLDDFGTGHSAMSHLHTLAIDEIKVAKPFVDRVCSDRRDQAIVKSTLTLCDHLGIDCVVEGVETTAQARQLEALGARLGQGFLWARPMTPQAFVERLAAEDARRPAAAGLRAPDVGSMAA